MEWNGIWNGIELEWMIDKPLMRYGMKICQFCEINKFLRAFFLKCLKTARGRALTETKDKAN
jgi:hypothetical protein